MMMLDVDVDLADEISRCSFGVEITRSSQAGVSEFQGEE